MKDITIISLGGSLIIPDNIDSEFLQRFKRLILGFIDDGKKFALICGGGKTARKYMTAAKEMNQDLTTEDLDWVGISCTKLNANLVKSLFKDYTNTEIIVNPTSKINFEKDVLIAAGWKPGCSTDYDAFLLAKNIGAKTIINLSNIDYAYDKDPRKYDDFNVFFVTSFCGNWVKWSIKSWIPLSG
jgi:uridylate kinase